ncbi:MAG: 4-hydroxy-tetrahydrodipicolinate reductase [Acidobacteria bacterium]|nr:4-hydroxy-tetrahydrodipicolinate reductase [Acidobacteriota bacterium]
MFLNKPRLALIGYGKMGRAVEVAARAGGFEIASILDIHNNAHGEGLTETALAGIDVGIDFTTPQQVIDNIRRVSHGRKCLVVGTTGWYDRLEEVKQWVDEAGIGMVYSPNFSLGVNLLFKLTAYAGEMINRLIEYDPFILEMHHNQKADNPSGTALQLGRILLASVKRKENLLTTAATGVIPPESLPVASVRAGHFFGSHTVGFDSPNDTLEIKHTARSRGGFAAGALLAATWIQGRRGVYEFSNILNEL